jgi:DNA-directed RNA polymerase subunit RPC12/RpoP
MNFNMKGKRKYKCADCQRTTMEHWTAMSRRCKPRCQGCGSTFLEPCSEGAVDDFVKAGTGRAINEKCPPRMGTLAEASMMRGERDIPGAKP